MTMHTQNGRRLRRHIAPLDAGEAFLHDFRGGFVPIEDGDVEAFGEEFIAAATSNEPIGELARDELYADELGGVAVDSDADEPDLP
ncbi:MAG TPA: hypothetical protein VIF62_31565 [Labilithrix sp.]|jgi:hypothetical protein